MIFKYPLAAKNTFTYSEHIKDYRRLTIEDKKILVNSISEYHKYIFWNLNLPFPTRDQLYMSSYLSGCVKSQEPLMLQAQRGLSKSLTAQIISTWLLLRNKNEKIVVISATAGRAESFTLFCLNLIKNVPLLQYLSPSSDQRGAGSKFDVAGRTPDDSPSVAAFGVTGSKTGSRASYIIYDDVEIPENSDTFGKREKILSGVRDTANLGIAGVFREVCICTPQSQHSVYNILVKEDGFKRQIIPAEYPENIELYDGDLAPHIEEAVKENPEIIGWNTDERLDMQHLIKQKVKGKSRYKLHYMLDTTMSDAEKYPLKLQDLIVMDIDYSQAPTRIEFSSDKKHCLFNIKHTGFRGDGLYLPRYISEERAKYEGIAMFIDPSGRGTDETAYAVSSHLGGKIFLLDFGGMNGGYEETVLVRLSEIAKLFKVNIIQIESNFGDGAFAELLKPYLRKIHNCLVEDVRSTTQKEKRIIETLEPTLMQHRLVVSKQAIEKDCETKNKEYSFTYQLSHIMQEKGCLKHDDRLDVVEMSVKYWQETLARSEDDEHQKHKEERDRLEIESMISDMFDIPNQDNFMSCW